MSEFITVKTRQMLRRGLIEAARDVACGEPTGLGDGDLRMVMRIDRLAHYFRVPASVVIDEVLDRWERMGGEEPLARCVWPAEMVLKIKSRAGLLRRRAEVSA